MMIEANIHPRDGRLQVSGEVSLATVSALRHLGEILMADSGFSAVDFSQAHCIDSSAVVLILAWLRFSRAQGKSLKLVQIPQHLLAVAEVYGINEIITNYSQSTTLTN